MTRDFDLIVLGAGSTGAAVARFAVDRGMRVCVIERQSLDRAGAHWVNDVPVWMFDAAGMHQPDDTVVERPAEFRGTPTRDQSMVLYAGWGDASLTLRRLRWHGVDMRALTRQLLDQARSKGVEVVDQTSCHAVDDDLVRTSAGTFRGRVIVDATGIAGLNLLGMSAVHRTDLCVAAQYVHDVADRAGAAAYFESRGVGLGDTIAFTGVHGGFSVLNIRWLGDRVGLLSGTIPALGHPSGATVIDRFVAETPWVGKRVYGGARAIPLCSPHEAFARGRIAQVGDAARQVFAAHGSGTGSGFLAAKLLVDTLASHGTPTDYMTRWMRTYGTVHNTFDLFRRFSQTLTIDDLQKLLRAGLLSDGNARAGVEQRMPPLAVRDLTATMAAAVRVPRLAFRAARYLAIAPMLGALTSRFPLRVEAHAQAFRSMRRLYALQPV